MVHGYTPPLPAIPNPYRVKQIEVKWNSLYTDLSVIILFTLHDYL